MNFKQACTNRPSLSPKDEISRNTVVVTEVVAHHNSGVS